MLDNKKYIGGIEAQSEVGQLEVCSLFAIFWLGILRGT
jgi:hypothetical protein